MNELRGPRTVLITGATGALGPAVLRAFEADGWTIRTLSRTPPASGAAAAAHQHFAADICDIDAVGRAMDGVDAVVHMAALLHVFDRSRSLTAAYHRVNVEGTAAVTAAARKSSVRNVVSLSSIAVYGPHRQMVDEHTAPEPDSPYAASKLEAERVALAGGGDRQYAAAVLRLAAIYGPSVKGNYERLVRALARRRFVPVGNGKNVRTLVFEDDAAAAIVLAATHERARGVVFNVTDGEIHSVSAITAAIAHALGRRPPRLHVPPPLALLGVTAVETLCKAARVRAPVSRETLEKYLENVAVSGRRICDTLGFQPRWTLDAGWRHTVAQLLHEGRL